MLELELVVARGTLLFARAGYEAAFGRAPAVALLRQRVDLLIAPIHEAAIGGQLVKLRNAAGDRAIDAIALSRTRELARFGERRVRACWDPERGALRIADLFS